jgi:hypothetical protein
MRLFSRFAHIASPARNYFGISGSSGTPDPNLTSAPVSGTTYPLQVTTTNANDFIAYSACNTNGSSTVGSGWTQIYSASGLDMYAGYQIVSSTQTNLQGTDTISASFGGGFIDAFESGTPPPPVGGGGSMLLLGVGG